MGAPEELATLVASSLGLTVGTSVFYDNYPDDAVDGSVGIWETPGPPSEHDLGRGVIRLEFPRIVVNVRHTTYATGKARIKAVAALFATIANQTLSGTRWLGLDAMAAPSVLKRDVNQRWIFSASWAGMKELS